MYFIMLSLSVLTVFRLFHNSFEEKAENDVKVVKSWALAAHSFIIPIFLAQPLTVIALCLALSYWSLYVATTQLTSVVNFDHVTFLSYLINKVRSERLCDSF